MKKKSYKEVINGAITTLYEQFEGLSNRQVINMIFDHIQNNNLIEDFTVTSLYNTIYYFLRKRKIFKTEEIRYRFDSIDSKLRFLETLRGDIDERWWFYHDLFFGDVQRPVLAADTKVFSGNLNYLMESKKGGAYDMMYTLLYFRDLRKIITSDMCTVFVKKNLNDNLYKIFEDLYELDRLVFDMIKSLDEDQMKEFKSILINYYGFLSDFNAGEYKQFHSRMIKAVNSFRQFIKTTDYPEIMDYNQNRFFDAITFCNSVYSCALQCMVLGEEFNPYRSIHYLVSSTSYYVFFKFAKKLKDHHYNRLVDFFNSDLFFSYTSYIIQYYQLFQKEVRTILDNANQDTDIVMGEFDIVLRYMLYNKLRNLVNSNLKRFIGVDFNVNEGSFVDVDNINDSEMFESHLYCQSEPSQDIAASSFLSAYENFFKCHDGMNRDDVTNVAVEICNGGCTNKFDPATVRAGMELVTLIRDNVQ